MDATQVTGKGPDDSSEEPSPPERARGGAEPAVALLDRVMAEIEQQVERQRLAGDMPARLAQELDALFARFAPVGSRRGEDLSAAVDMVDAVAFIDPMVPVESRIPGGRFAKRLLRKLGLWYASYLTGQVSRFAATVARVLHGLDDRMSEIESSVLSAVPPPGPVVAEAEGERSWWEAKSIEALDGCRGRVLHVACGDGHLVRSLVEHGIDAYGVDPRRDLLEPAAIGGLDLRSGEVLDHLGVLGKGVLGGVVVSGIAEGLPPGARGRLLDLLDSRLDPEGVMVLHSLTLSSWERSRDGVEADLSSGRPMRATTWQALLADRGFGVEIHDGPPLGGLGQLPGKGDETAVANANFRLLDQVLFGPADYLVIARRLRPSRPSIR
jgi:hypothetical protein